MEATLSFQGDEVTRLAHGSHDVLALYGRVKKTVDGGREVIGPRRIHRQIKFLPGGDQGLHQVASDNVLELTVVENLPRRLRKKDGRVRHTPTRDVLIGIDIGVIAADETGHLQKRVRP